MKKLAKTSAKKMKKIKQKTYFVLILDKSGSMRSCSKQAVDHFNEQIQAIKSLKKGQEVRVYLVLFNHFVEMKLNNQPLSKIKQLKEQDYIADGTTSLYDAIGMTIDTLKKDLTDLDKDNVKVFFSIVTDGHENSSHDYGGIDGAKKLKETITELQKDDKWTFAYLGANHDVFAVASTFGMKTAYVSGYVSNAVGTAAATRGSITQLGNFFTGNSNPTHPLKVAKK